VSSLPDDHYRTVHVVKYGLRDAAKEKAADCSESSGSENDEVDIAAARDPHDFPRRIAVRHQSLDWMSSFGEYCDGVRQHLVCMSGFVIGPVIAAFFLVVWEMFAQEHAEGLAVGGEPATRDAPEERFDAASAWRDGP
jgi:hypothetical protein